MYTNEERARIAHDDAIAEQFHEAQAAYLYEEAYEAWASDRRDDDPEADDSREAYDDYLVGQAEAHDEWMADRR